MYMRKSPGDWAPVAMGTMWLAARTVSAGLNQTSLTTQARNSLQDLCLAQLQVCCKWCVLCSYKIRNFSTTCSSHRELTARCLSSFHKCQVNSLDAVLYRLVAFKLSQWMVACSVLTACLESMQRVIEDPRHNDTSGQMP